MAQWIKVLAAQAWVLILTPGTYVEREGLDRLSDLTSIEWHGCPIVHTYLCLQRNKKINSKIKAKMQECTCPLVEDLGRNMREFACNSEGEGKSSED